MKRLSSHQARWALFFTHFIFTLTYRPRARNTKPDALSRLYSAEAKPTGPDPILPPSSLIAAVTWDIEGLIRAAQVTNPDTRTTRNNTRPRLCPFTGPGMGTFLPSGMLSGCTTHADTSQEEFLVAHHCSGYPGVCAGLSRMWQE